MSRHHTPFFIYPMTMSGSQKGAHPERWKFVLWRANHLPCWCVFNLQPPRAECDLRQLLFAHLKKLDSPLPSAATWILLAIISLLITLTKCLVEHLLTPPIAQFS
jgi:hypothetical protein